MEELQVRLPAALENMQLPAPELVQYYKNQESRTLWLDSDVDSSWLEYERNIIQWNREDKDIPVEQRKPIKLFIFSDGGELDSCYSIIDAIELSKTPVYTINAGVSLSAGMLIFIAGRKRFVFKRSEGLIHTGSGGFAGTYDQTVEAVSNYKRQIEIMKNYIIEKTKIDKKTLQKNSSKDWYLSAEEMIQYGCADKIVEDIDEVL